ncbi:MAG: hypothetical protein LBB39_03160 [Mycoplasmataceae bacterium]|nr:hypothetical protein [Mycoplasmataceae bacterium]
MVQSANKLIGSNIFSSLTYSEVFFSYDFVNVTVAENVASEWLNLSYILLKLTNHYVEANPKINAVLNILNYFWHDRFNFSHSYKLNKYSSSSEFVKCYNEILLNDKINNENTFDEICYQCTVLNPNAKLFNAPILPKEKWEKLNKTTFALEDDIEFHNYY